jgi:hypothetical protein
VTIRENIPGPDSQCGMRQSQYYIEKDISRMYRYLKKAIEEGKKVYISSNQRQFCQGLQSLIETDFPAKSVLCLTGDSPPALKKTVALDTDKAVRACDVFIVSPVFTNGHSISAGSFLRFLLQGL